MKKTNSRTSANKYVYVSENIYFDGKSYRVRVSKNKVKHTKNFPSKKKALSYRKELVG